MTTYPVNSWITGDGQLYALGDNDQLIVGRDGALLNTGTSFASVVYVTGKASILVQGLVSGGNGRGINFASGTQGVLTVDAGGVVAGGDFWNAVWASASGCNILNAGSILSHGGTAVAADGADFTLLNEGRIYTSGLTALAIGSTATAHASSTSERSRVRTQ